MRRFLPFAFMALLVPACALAQNTPTSATAASSSEAPVKAKPKSAFGEVIAELTRAAQEKAASKGKPTAANASTPELPAPSHPAAKATLADSSGG